MDKIDVKKDSSLANSLVGQTDNSGENLSNTDNSSNGSTVNSNKDIIKTVNGNPSKFGIYLDGNDYENDNLANDLADKLDDQNSLTFYRILAKETNHELLREVLAYVLATDREKKIKRTKAIYFMFLLKVRGVRTKFKKDENQ